MNERIQELAKDAKYSIEQEGILLELVLEKFAELIVRECATYAFSNEQDYCAMLNHFGIE